MGDDVGAILGFHIEHTDRWGAGAPHPISDAVPLYIDGRKPVHLALDVLGDDGHYSVVPSRASLKMGR